MAVPWFHVESLPPAGGTWLLTSEEARHATGSRRLAAGDEVVLFDGNGGIAAGTLGSARHRDGSLPVHVTEVRPVAWVGRRVHLVSALPKGDRLSTLVDMTTQLGVASFAPLKCARSVVSGTDGRAERIRRIQVEACKQARWPWLPELRPETTIDRLAQRAASDGPLLVAHPGGEPVRDLVAAAGVAPAAHVTVAIGPEGGFTDDELVALAAAGATRVDLGPTILRIETAAVIAISLVR